VAFSPNGKFLASASAGGTVKVGSAEGTVRVWDLTTFREGKPIPGSFPPCMTFSTDSLYLLARAANNEIKVWDFQTGKEKGVLARDVRTTWCLAFSPNGQRLAVAGLDWDVKVWECDPTRLGKVQEPKSILLPVRVNGFTNRVAFSRDGQRPVTGGEEQ